MMEELQALRTDYNDCSQLSSNLSEACEESEAPVFTGKSLVKVSVLFVMAVGSLVGNCVTVTSIIRNRKLRASSFTSLYSLLLQLAIADLLVTTWCIIGEAAWTYTVQWVAGEGLCKFFKFFQVFSLYLSTFITVVIGFDRLRAVRHPIRRAVSSNRFCLRPIAAIWILSAVFASPQVVIFRVVRGPFLEDFYQCVTYGFYTAAWQEQLYTVFSLLTMFILPLAVLTTSYIVIFYTIGRKEKTFQLDTGEEASEPMGRSTLGGSVRNQQNALVNRRQYILRRAKAKSLQFSLIIVTAFVVCWTPYYVMMIVFVFLEVSDEVIQDLQSAIFFFGMSNSLVNPVIYGAFHLWGPRHKLQMSFSSTQTEFRRRGSQRPGTITGPPRTIPAID